jgi:glucose-6-phosphate 1-epimerase
MTITPETLNTTYALSGALHFAELAPGLPVAEIHTPLARARVALQGGQVLNWQPARQQPVLWVSKAAVFEVGKPVRGGVPVCWPWFGAMPGKSMHGFVRNLMWQVRGTEVDAAGQVVLRMGLRDDAATRAIWNHAFDLELTLTVGTTLTMALTTRNIGGAPMTITQALHTYFGTADITQTSVQGLEGGSYLDKVQSLAVCQQSGAVRFTGETDRIYTDTRADSLIHDAAGGRCIRIAKQGSASTVVWNPWIDKEKTMADMATGEYRHMLCVETCNAGSDSVTVAAGETHALVARISVE